MVSQKSILALLVLNAVTKGVIMKHTIIEICTKLATIVAVLNDRYPLYIPFDVINKHTFVTEEWILSFTLTWETHNGFYIYNDVTKEIKLFSGLLEVATYLYDHIIDLDQLNERVDIAAQAEISVLKRSLAKIREVYDEEFIETATGIREALENALRETGKTEDIEHRSYYLAKLPSIDYIKKEPHLTIVKDKE